MRREEHRLSRVYTVTDEFFNNDKSAFQTLVQENFFKKEGPTENVEAIHGALRAIVQGRRSHLTRDYGTSEGLRELDKDLCAIRGQLLDNDVFPDLEEDDIVGLRKQIGALLKITSYLRTFDIRLGE